MTMNAHQRQIYGSIAAATGIATPPEDVRVEQSPTFLKEPMQIADFAAGVVTALGTSVAELGQARGLPEQDVFVDRRHALLTLNNWQYHYMNGVHIVGGEITVPVNGIYETRDGRPGAENTECAVVVSGEPGVGETALIDQMCARVDSYGIWKSASKM